MPTTSSTPFAVSVGLAAGQSNRTNAYSVSFAVDFAENVTNVSASSFVVTPASTSMTVNGSGANYTLVVFIANLTDGTAVTATLPAGRVNSGNRPNAQNAQSTSTANTVVFDITPPSVPAFTFLGNLTHDIANGLSDLSASFTSSEALAALNASLISASFSGSSGSSGTSGTSGTSGSSSVQLSVTQSDAFTVALHAVLSPSLGLDGYLNFTLAAGAFADQAGNLLQEARSLKVRYDSLPPKVFLRKLRSARGLTR